MTMLKKIIVVLITLIPFISKAQVPVGDWNVYSMFSTIKKMVQTPDKVYYISGTNLFSFDKNTQESYNYSPYNKLSENIVDDIFYNNEKKYLVITYTSGNIDLLYDDGSVVNLPDIKNASINYSREINDVAFLGDCIYVATKFGIIIYNEARQEVKNSCVYGKEVSLITCVGDYVVIDQNHALYYLDTKENKYIEDFNNFTLIKSGYWIEDIEGLNNNKLLFRATNKSIYLLDLDFEKNTCKSTNICGEEATNLIYGKDLYYYIAGNIIYSIDKEGVKIKNSTLPVELSSQTISIWDNVNELWVGDSNGIGNYNIENNITILYDKFKPQAIGVDYPFYITSDKKGKLYISNKSESKYYGFSFDKQAFISTIENDIMENITPTEFTTSHNRTPSKDVLYDIYQLAIDPEDDEIYYLGSHWEGMYKVKDGKTIAQYNPETSTLLESWGCRVNAIAFDKENNLWCTCEVINNGETCLHILPAAARKKDKTTKEDWIPISLGDFRAEKDVQILICKKSNMIFIIDGKWGPSIVAYDTKGTYTDTSDDTYMLWNSFVDQDGKSYTYERVSALVEDNDGRVWIGTNNGIVEITNPKNAINSSLTVNRLKVPRNDGTNYADYLLDAIHVTSISVDNSNRKWIGTMTDGVYLVSESGNQILEHFTSENSYHPGGITYCVFAHPFSNSVFIGTEFGLVEYGSTSTPAHENYSEIYAYPNPVKPNYSGLVVIKGLMENSLVKISDSAGNVFYTSRSEGGMVTWDCCNSVGERVKSGVYFVFVSQNGNGDSSGAVTKIMVIN